MWKIGVENSQKSPKTIFFRKKTPNKAVTQIGAQFDVGSWTKNGPRNFVPSGDWTQVLKGMIYKVEKSVWAEKGICLGQELNQGPKNLWQACEMASTKVYEKEARWAQQLLQI